MSNANITQPSFSSGILSTELFSRIDFNKIETGLKQCENFVIRPAGGAIFRAGTYYISETKYPLKNVALIPFVFNRKDGLCLEFGDKYIRFYKNGKRVETDGIPYEVETPYLESEVKDIKFCQNKNDVYLAHENHPPALLHRNTDVDWTYTEMSLNPTLTSPSEVTITADGAKHSEAIVKTEWQYAVSAVDEDGQESFVTYSNKIESDVDLLNQPINVSWSEVISLDKKIKEYRVYRIKAGDFYLVYIQSKKGDGETYKIKDVSFAPNTSIAPKEKFTAFGEGKYPRAVGMWNQRLIFAGTKEKPSTFWMSRVKQYEDFTKSIVNAADDGIELTFNSGTLDAITDIVPMDDLIVFTEGKIWRVSGTSVSNMSAYIESYSGSCGIRPFATKKSVLFVDSSKNIVSNFIYSYELNGYTGQNLDTLSRQLFDGYTIEDISYRDSPYGVMYAIRNDGVMLGLTYMREENIYAWHKHTTSGGLFKAVCAVDGDKEDNVYVAVQRGEKTYIETFGSYIDETEDINDALHLDCATKFVSNTWSYRRINESIDEEEKVLIEQKKAHVATINLIRDGYYTITLVGGGGGSSTQYGSAGAYVKVVAYLKKGEYKFAVGGGGYGAGPYARNHNGGAGYMSYFGGNEFAIVVDNGHGGVGTRNPGYTVYRKEEIDLAGYHFVVGTDLYPKYHVYGNTDYTILESNPAQYKPGSFFEGYGAGGYGVGKKDGGRAGTAGYFKLVEQGYSYEYKPYDYLYTKGEPKLKGEAYTDITFATSYEIDAIDENNNITVNGKVYNFESRTAPSLEEVTGLERFNDQGVCIVVDTNVYDAYVQDGKVDLPYESANVTVGLRYTGILETIPKDFASSNSQTTIGGMRKINDGTLYYYRARGLWYGRDVDHLYEIKPYTRSSFAENIPLESGKIDLKVADGYSLENSFVVAQKSPMPALIQSITLGSQYNDKY